MLFDQYSQVDIENSLHKGKTEILQKEIELLKKKVMNLSGRLEEKEMEVESLRQRVGRDREEVEDEGEMEDREEGG
jgi:molecular chaperone GrpE (heat shock protein)